MIGGATSRRCVSQDSLLQPRRFGVAARKINSCATPRIHSFLSFVGQITLNQLLEDGLATALACCQTAATSILRLHGSGSQQPLR
ncbi:hypothetical protein RJ55_08706 [Drechmeria coniospora]|nr:hypothetical protein RJ55_08706 [Drechmeria coniospora]